VRSSQLSDALIPEIRRAIWQIDPQIVIPTLKSMDEQVSAPKERTLVLCDETGNLGRIDALLTAITMIRLWGLTLWLFWQKCSAASNIRKSGHYVELFRRVLGELLGSLPKYASKKAIALCLFRETLHPKHPRT
jgi:hypothetical protein